MATKVHRVPQDQLELVVQSDRVVVQVLKEIKVRKVQLATREHQVARVNQDNKELLVLLETLDSPESPERGVN